MTKIDKAFLKAMAWDECPEPDRSMLLESLAYTSDSRKSEYIVTQRTIRRNSERRMAAFDEKYPFTYPYEKQ